jgi:hypothetical protein
VKEQLEATHKEVAMDTLLIIILIAVVLRLVVSALHPAPRPQIIYVPIEVATPQGGRGCLPLIIVVIIVLLVLLALGGIQI